MIRINQTNRVLDLVSCVCTSLWLRLWHLLDTGVRGKILQLSLFHALALLHFTLILLVLVSFPPVSTRLHAYIQLKLSERSSLMRPPTDHTDYRHSPIARKLLRPCLASFAAFYPFRSIDRLYIAVFFVSQ